MSDKGVNTKKQQHLVTSPENTDQESQETTPPPPQSHHQVVVHGGASFPPPSMFVPSSTFEQFEALNSKRPRYTTGQWKLLPSPSRQKQSQVNIVSTESTPSPSAPVTNTATNPPAQPQNTAASSSDTASSPSHSPRATRPVATGQETTKPEDEQMFRQQFRKGKYVSPVWKPNEMLWLARAWRAQYQRGADGSNSSVDVASADTGAAPPGRGKTRADKDREVAEFLNRHGVNRDAKTAGTKWDNMLGEFRKVYEWERGGERDHVGKSYFRLSPYERKIHRLPASFDEEVFEELAQFMGARMRIPHSRGGSSIGYGADVPKSLPQPPPFRDDDLALSAGRSKQIFMTGGGVEPFYHATRGNLLGFESSPFEAAAHQSFSSLKEPRRIGKIRMIWEELVNLWSESEGEHHIGRVKLHGSSFLGSDELAFLDDSMVACTMEAFEDGHLKGFSVDRFVSGQQVKVFGRRKSSLVTSHSDYKERMQLRSGEISIRSIPQLEFQDPTEYYMGCLRVPPPTLPSLYELSWHIQEPAPEELRFPVRKEVYGDLPQGKELFFTTSTEPLDSRAITADLLSPILRSNPSLSSATATSRDSFIGLWDDCINRIISKFCAMEMVFVRKPSTSIGETIQDQWPNVTAFLRNFCLWRGEETDQLREGYLDPSSSIVEKILWTWGDLPYVLGYHAIGYIVTFCALSRSKDHVIRTDLYKVDLSTPAERIKVLVPCWRIAGLLPLLADRCCNFTTDGSRYKTLPYSDFERIELVDGSIMEMTPNTVIRFFTSKSKWAALKGIYDFLDQRIPHAEHLLGSSEKDLALVYKPRGCRVKPANCDQLIEALKHVTKALVALHDLSFMHRDLNWDKVMKMIDSDNDEDEWFITGFDHAADAPQLYPHSTAASGRHAPEMASGLHGVKVDVWGVGHLIKTCGLAGVPKLLRELQNRCLDHIPEQRPTAADCYRHLLQLQSTAAAAGGY